MNDEREEIKINEQCSSVLEESQSPYLTFYQRKMLKLQQETLASFGGGLGDIINPKLSKLEKEK